MRIFLIAAVVLSFAFAGLYSSSQAGETKAKTEEMKGEVKADAERTKGEAKGLKEDIKGNDVKADVERAEVVVNPIRVRDDAHLRHAAGIVEKRGTG